MAAKMSTTATPGVYKRGGRYVVVYRVDGKQRKEFAPTYDAARALKSKRDTERRDGTFQAPAKLLFGEYARDWIDGYQGKGRGFRERTRRDYRRDLERYIIPFLGDKRLADLRRSDMQAFVAWLANERAQVERQRKESAGKDGPTGRPLREPGLLADHTIARIVVTLKACLSSAVLDELRRDNPAARVVLPKRDPLPMPDDGDELEGQAKALTRAEVTACLAIIHPHWRTLFRLLTATGLRISEALALDVKHVALTGSRPHVKVRRAYGRDGMDRPKSEHGVRDIPLPQSLVHELREHIASLPEPSPTMVKKWGHLLFPSATGAPMSQENLRRRVLKPAAEEAGCGWAGFHAFRHTFASLHIERATNIVRLSRLLGHHKASFTLDVYSHMLDDGYGDPLDIDAELAQAGSADVDAEIAAVLEGSA